MALVVVKWVTAGSILGEGVLLRGEAVIWRLCLAFELLKRC